MGTRRTVGKGLLSQRMRDGDEELEGTSVCLLREGDVVGHTESTKRNGK